MVIHTPYTYVVALVIFYCQVLQISIYVKTGSKNKVRILSMDKILEQLKREYNSTDLEQAASSIVSFHAFTGSFHALSLQVASLKKILLHLLKCVLNIYTFLCDL